MKVSFDDLRVSTLFNDLDLMVKKIGFELTKKIKKRYEQLRAAENFAIYLKTGLGSPHPLYENLKGRYGVWVNKHIRLIVKPVTDDLSIQSLTKCEEIIIEGVVDYHGNKTTTYIP